MPLLVYIFVAGLGLILGSFLNALLFRFNTGRSVLKGRSACMRCGHELSSLDLVPLLSYLFLRGKCRYCRARISWQYPAVEAMAAVLAVFAYLQNPEPLWFLYWFGVWLVLLFIVVYDLRHQIIPWSATLVLMALALGGALLGFFSQSAIVGESMGYWGLLVGPILAGPLLLISLVSRGRWMGWGDGILELSLGWLLGLTAGFTALLIAFWSGALIGIALLLVFKNRYTMSSEVPFAPFLILGAATAYFFHADFFQSLTLLL
ncbi:MAG: Prepilin peptidase [Candidatus Adlerbacteria bacterium]|nr:Prepilin peptidase [Candidatus Adlerbacteria bacterium]